MFLLPEIALSLVLFSALYHVAPFWVLRVVPTASYAGVQNTLLLAFSCTLFACLAPHFLALLALYWLCISLTIKLANPSNPTHKALFASALITLSVAVLSAVKYYNPVREFLALQSASFAGLPALNLVLGFSASFLTFQFITLAVQWWRGELPANTSTLHLAVFVAFFPTLAAGPITRASALLPQLNTRRSMIAPRYAFARILLGVWQMLVCAQWLADTWVNPIYAAPQNHHGAEVLAAALAYSLQIYLDFSGLSNIVIGLGWLLGLRLPRNFRSPYAAVNIREFWRRWHMSLSTWIRDYLYKPLGGSRKGFLRAQAAVALSMGLSGIWHGAALTFMAWAGLHIVAVIALNTLDKSRWQWRLPHRLGVGLTFAWVSAAWVFFRADNLEHAVTIFQAMGNSQTLIQYNVIGFTGLLAVFFIIQKHGSCCAERVMRGLLRLPHWGFAIFVLISVYLAIELGPSGVPNFIYAGF